MKKLKLNLGCGRDKKEGFINIDRDANVKPDIVCNLGHERIPLPDNSVNYVLAHNFFEHLDSDETAFLIEELYRVCENGAIIDITCPHYLSPTSSSVFHKQWISEAFFNIYDVEGKHDTISADSKRYFKISYKISYQRYRKWLPIPIPCNIYFKLEVVK